MSSLVEQVKNAVDDFQKPGRTLLAALQSAEGTPEDMGKAWGLLMGGGKPQSIPAVADGFLRLLQGREIGLRDDIALCLQEFQRRVIDALAGDPDAQVKSGVIPAWLYAVESRHPDGHPMIDPTGGPWAHLPRWNGRWVVLPSFPAGVALPLVLADDAARLTTKLEARRREVEDEFRLREEQRAAREEAEYRNSTPGRIKALEAEIAKLRLQQGQAAAI